MELVSVSKTNLRVFLAHPKILRSVAPYLQLREDGDSGCNDDRGSDRDDRRKFHRPDTDQGVWPHQAEAEGEHVQHASAGKVCSGLLGRGGGPGDEEPHRHVHGGGCVEWVPQQRGQHPDELADFGAEAPKPQQRPEGQSAHAHQITEDRREGQNGPARGGSAEGCSHANGACGLSRHGTADFGQGGEPLVGFHGNEYHCELPDSHEERMGRGPRSGEASQDRESMEGHRLGASLDSGAASASSVEEGDKKFREQNVQKLLAAKGSVDRFYPVQLEPRKKKEGKNNSNETKDTDEEEQEAQIWVVRFSSGQAGKGAKMILKALESDSLLKDLMDARMRPDRAPQGSMAKALQAPLRSSAD